MKTLRKAGELLRIFTAEQPEHSVTDMARAIQNSVSGTHDLVTGLMRIGLLRKVERGRYRLGPLVASLNRVLVDSSPLIGAAQPVLAGLWRDYGETLHLTVQDHDRLVVLDALEGTQGLRVSRDVLGAATPLHDCPPGLIHLSQLSQLQLNEYLQRHKRPGNPLDRLNTLRDRLVQIAQDGFAAGPPGPETDVICVSAEIVDQVSHSGGVLVMSVPRSRHEVQPRAYRNIVTEASQRISDQLEESRGRYR